MEIKILILVYFFSFCVLRVESREASISLREIVANLRCSNWGASFQSDASNVGDVENMVCSSGASFYNRLNFEVRSSGLVDGKTSTSSNEHSIYVSSSDGDLDTLSMGHGCPDTKSNDRSNECTKMTLPLQVPGTQFILKPGSGLERSLEKNIQTLHEEGVFGNTPLSYLSIEDAIQGIEVEFDISPTRWAYDLTQQSDHIVPFGYIVFINTTQAAYEEAVNASLSSTILDSGLYTKLSRCVPNLYEESGRLGGKLGGCFRAPCNCTNDQGGQYTFELHWVAPNCHMRKVLNAGRPRLTATMDIRFYATTKVAGVIIDRRLILDKRLWDLTTTFQGSSTNGRTGLNGRSNMNLRMTAKQGPNGISIGGTDAVLSSSYFSGSGAIGQEVMMRSHLIETLQKTGTSVEDQESEGVKLGGSQNDLGFDGAPILNGGYVVDCLTDEEVYTSPYRNSGQSPFDTLGLPENINAPPPDKWLYVSDGVSRDQFLFSTQLRDSCGLIGISSAAVALDFALREDVCCNGDLLNGACVPGSTNDASANSIQEVLEEESGELFRTLFSPPGWSANNYYLSGRSVLNLQTVSESVSGLSGLIHGAPEGFFNFTIELSDIVVQALTGGVASKVNIPPLRLEAAQMKTTSGGNETTLSFHLKNESLACVYNSDGSGNGVFIFQRLCNVANGGSFANVSIEFEGCQGLTLYEGTEETLSGPYQLLDQGPLQPGGCYDMFTQSMYVPSAKGIVNRDVLLSRVNQPYCDRIHISSTKGSTREITVENIVCTPVYGTYGQSIEYIDQTLTLNENDLDPNCEECDLAELHCLNRCGRAVESFYFWITIVIPLMSLIILLVVFIALAVYRDEKNKLLSFELLNAIN